MRDDDRLKVYVHYGGLMVVKGDKLCYKGGSTAPFMYVDPDYMTFSLFEDFKRSNSVVSDVEELWYSLPGQELSVSRSVKDDKDKQLMQMCSEAKECGEVHVYLGHSEDVCGQINEDIAGEALQEIGEANEEPDNVVVQEGGQEEAENIGQKTGEEAGEDVVVESEDGDDQEREENSSDEDRPEEENVEDLRHAEEVEDEGAEDESEILAEGSTDIRFEGLFREGEKGIRSETLHPVAHDDGYDSEIEADQAPPPGEYPESGEDTDEEWANWKTRDQYGRKLLEKSQADYCNAPYLWLMQTFSNVNEFKDQLLRYVLKTQYDVKLSKWDSYAHAAVCTHEDCKWRIYCSIEKPIRKWMVKVYEDNHNHLPTGRARMLKQGTIARLFKEEARRRPEIRSTDIKDELMHWYNINVSIYICRKARRIALDMVLETQKEQFAKLWDYEAELRRSNKDITTEILTVEKEGRQVFHSFYICFEPIRRLWKQNCRPFIGLDGAFLKWELKGEILSAVGRDAENRIFPIAWAIVRGENTESWEWFIRKLKEDLDLGLGHGFSFISDRQKGLKNALASVLPNAEHRNCAKHVYANWKKKYGDVDYKPYFWNVAYSRTEAEYTTKMEELRYYDGDAYEDLLKAEPQSWCLAFQSSTPRTVNVCNGLSESFNNTIRGARELPLINMLEAIRKQVMTRISRRFKKASNCILPFPKKIAHILEKNRERSKDAHVLTSSDNLFEVDMYGCSYEVSLRVRHCVCREWDLTGIPCSHAIRVINEKRLETNNHVDFYYKTGVWVANYSDNIKPVNGEKYWIRTGKEPIAVPGFRNMPGRPKKKRQKSAHESPSKPNRVTRDGRKMTCSKCKSEGHNKATCKNEAYVVQGPTRKRGRPPKIVDPAYPLPHKRRKTSTVTPPTTRMNQSAPSSSAPQSSVVQEPQSQASSAAPSSTAPTTTTAPRRCRPAGRGQSRRVNVPRGHGIYMCPNTNRVFECVGSAHREIGGQSQRGRGGGQRGRGRGDGGRGRGGTTIQRGRGRGFTNGGRGRGITDGGRGIDGTRSTGRGQRGRGFIWDVLGC